MTVSFLLNGRNVVLDDPDPDETVLDWLRIRNGLTGTKEGCNEGDCGACTVIASSLAGDRVRHRAVNACILLLPHLDGKAIRTVEGVGAPNRLHPVQAAMVADHGSQCGFCTPGFIMSMTAAHAEGRTDHDDVLAGNLCRCTGYAPIIRAAEAARKAPPPPWLEADAAALRDLARTSRPTTTGRESCFRPRTADELAAWYADNPDATLVAGGTDLGLRVTKSLATIAPACFIAETAGLGDIVEEDGGLRIGAAAKFSELREAIGATHPDFAELIRRFGSEQVRNSATVGGNIANGSPIGDSPPPLIALGATLRLRQGNARRDIPLEDFFIDYGRQDIRPGEFIESLFMPARPGRLRCFKLSKRFDQDITAVLGCFNIAVEGNRVVSARIAYGGMAGTPVRARRAEAALLGAPWTERGVQDAAAALSRDFTPISDMRASAGYRMAAAGNMLVRCVLEDLGRAPRIPGWQP